MPKCRQVYASVRSAPKGRKRATTRASDAETGRPIMGWTRALRRQPRIAQLPLSYGLEGRNRQVGASGGNIINRKTRQQARAGGARQHSLLTRLGSMFAGRRHFDGDAVLIRHRKCRVARRQRKGRDKHNNRHQPSDSAAHATRGHPGSLGTLFAASRHVVCLPGEDGGLKSYHCDDSERPGPCRDIRATMGRCAGCRSALRPPRPARRCA